MNNLPNILTKDSFSKEVEKFVLETGSDYMDAVLHICQLRDIEPETAAKLLNANLKNMIEKEASSLNLVEKTQSLSFE
jgi:hypothetical protein